MTNQHRRPSLQGSPSAELQNKEDIACIISSGSIDKRSERVSTTKREEKTVKKAKKTVRFDVHRNRVAVQNSQELHDKEKFWYKASDYKTMIMERLQTVEAVCMAEGDVQSLDQDQYCIRGLENDIFPVVRKHQKRRVRTVIHTVIDHQRLYGKIGIPPTSIAGTLGALSRCASAASQEEARAVALMDAAAVQFPLSSELQSSADHRDDSDTKI